MNLLLVLSTWLVTYLIHSTLFFGAAWTIDRLRLLRAPALLELLWRGALVGALVTATAQTAGFVERVPLAAVLDLSSSDRFAAPAVRPGGAPAEFEPASTPAPEAAVSPRPRIAAARIAAAPASSEALAPAAPILGWMSAHGLLLLSLLWFAGALLLALRLAAQASLARRELAGRTRAETGVERELVALCAAQGIAPPALSVAAGLASPVTLPNGEIVLPRWAADGLDAPQRTAILAHELAHRVRRDPQWRIACLALERLLWMQPFHRTASRRLTELAELEADAWAARALNDPRPLVESLALCAERLLARRGAQFSSGMFPGMFSARPAEPSTPSPLLQRVDRLLKGTVMLRPQSSWAMRCAVLLSLVAGTFLLPGCGPAGLRALGSGSSTHISVSDGGDTSVTLSRPGYALRMESEGEVTFAADESDVATLAAHGEFQLTEKIDGVKHEYEVKADAQGNLARSYRRDGSKQPLDEASRLWLAQALPRMFRESGFDADARVARLLAKGGPDLVLAEVDLASSDHAKGAYLGRLLGTTTLEAAQLDRALASAARIDSAYELRRALEGAFRTQKLDGARWTRLLETARQIDSDYELAELLIPVAGRMPAEAGPVELQAWLDAAIEIGSDYELRRTLEAAAARPVEGAFLVSLLGRAAERLGSDYELRSMLESVAPRSADPAVYGAYLAAARQLESDFERRSALEALLAEGKLDSPGLAGALDATAEMGSSHDKLTMLEKLARDVSSHPELERRYREVARELDDYERGAALRALDDAGSR
jgi:Zn-dependent protease with chaperone function